MSHLNPTPILIYTGVALIAFDHFGYSAAGVVLIVGAVFSGIVSGREAETMP